MVYCKKPFKDADKVVDYLGRYTHRVAISNNRILKLEDGKVTFKWRDYKDGNKVKEMTITVDEFIRRFILHILPSGLHKIRHYGLLAPKGKSARIMICKKLTNTLIKPFEPRKPLEIIRDILGDEFNKCPQCGVGKLRAPPDLIADEASEAAA